MIASILAILGQVNSHAILVNPPPRTTGQMSFSEIGIKIANFPPTAEQLNSCLDSAPSPTALQVKSGSQIPVEWSITIPHSSDPGVRIAMQFGDNVFEIMQDNIDINAKTAKITIPSDKSGKAVVQWLWATQEDGGFYMACADVEIVAQVVEKNGKRRCPASRKN